MACTVVGPTDRPGQVLKHIARHEYCTDSGSFAGSSQTCELNSAKGNGQLVQTAAVLVLVKTHDSRSLVSN